MLTNICLVLTFTTTINGALFIPSQYSKSYYSPRGVYTFLGGQAKCHEYGAKLVLPESSDIQNYVLNEFSNKGDSDVHEYWLGAISVPFQASFVYADGSAPLSYTNWADGQPQLCPSNHCAATFNGSGHWRGCDVLYTKHIICERPYLHNPTGSFIKGPFGKQYLYNSTSVRFSEALDTCENLGGSLVTTNTEEVLTWVLQNITHGQFWAGGRYFIADGRWHWLSQDTWSYDNWWVRPPAATPPPIIYWGLEPLVHPTQPPDRHRCSYGSKCCLYIVSQSEWLRYDCRTSIAPFICERDPLDEFAGPFVKKAIIDHEHRLRSIENIENDNRDAIEQAKQHILSLFANHTQLINRTNDGSLIRNITDDLETYMADFKSEFNRQLSTLMDSNRSMAQKSNELVRLVESDMSKSSSELQQRFVELASKDEQLSNKIHDQVIIVYVVMILLFLLIATPMMIYGYYVVKIRPLSMIDSRCYYSDVKKSVLDPTDTESVSSVA